MNKSYKPRVVFIFLIFCLLYIIILLNLYFIQIRQHDFYVGLGNKQYNITVSRYPARAEIFDRNNRPLALNKDCLSAFILPQQLTEKDRVATFLKEHFPHAYERFNKNNHSNFMFIQRRLTKEQQAIIEQNNFKDIKFLKERGRYYPSCSTASIIGATDIDNKGVFGIELQYDESLRGIPTICSLEQEARSGNFYFKKETKQTGHEGKPITLTIDSNLQFLAQEELEETLKEWDAQEGSVIIMNPTTGEILAMVNAPGYDPNNLSDLDLETTKNKAITECYELGSIAKVFTGMAALEEKLVDINEIFDCHNSKTAYVDGRKVNTLTAHGKLTFSEVIELSNNIGIATVAIRLQDKLFNHFTRLGFGKKTDLAFPGEQSGFINPPENWSKQSIISLSYGYEMTCNLMQVARAFCTIARNGYPIEPKLVINKEQVQQEEKKKPLYSEETIDLIKQILEKTALHGTAKKSNIKGYTIMSKTGTANLLVDGNYSQTNNIYTCAGIIQKGNYQRVVVTFVKEAKKTNAFAATVAAPLFAKIAQKTVISDKII